MGVLGPRHLGRGVADPLETYCSHVCYYTKFGRSRSNRLGISRWPQNWGGLGPAAWDVRE